MTPQDRTEKALELLRDLPAEVSVEDVSQMVTLFPLIQPTTSWFSHINLNSILMTTAGTMIVAGITYFCASVGITEQVASIALTPTDAIEIPIAATLEEVKAMPRSLVDTEAIPPVLQEQIGLVAEPSVPTPAPMQVPAPLPNATPAAPPTPAPSPTPASVQSLGQEPSTAPSTMPATAPTPPQAPIAPVPAAPCNEIRMRTEAEKSFNLTGFKTVKVLGSIEVAIDQGPFSVNAEGDESALKSLVVTSEGGKLVISAEGNNDYEESAEKGGKKRKDRNSGSTMLVLISMPDLERVELLGPGDIHISEFTDLSSMEFDLHGSGDIHFVSLKGLNELSIALAGSVDIFGDAAEVSGTTRIAIAGSGDVLIAGRTDKMNISVVGSGDVEASGLEANGGDINVTGSGDVRVNSKGSVSTTIMGSGEVHNIGSSGDGPHTD